MKHYKAICFDFDYTLGDSTDSIVAGFAHAMTMLGHPVPDRETVRKTVGYMLEDAYTIISGDDSPENRAKFRTYFIEVALERQRRETTLFPGAVELLRGLKEAGVRCGIVSSKRGDTIEIIMGRHKVLDCLELVIGSENVTSHKPDPEGLLWAMERLGLEKGEVLFCGDTVIDAETAKNAGCDFAAVLNGTTGAEAFDAWPHVHISPDLYDLAKWLGIG